MEVNIICSTFTAEIITINFIITMEAITMNISTRSRRISRTVQWARSHKWMIELADPGLQAQCKSYKDGKKIINP